MGGVKIGKRAEISKPNCGIGQGWKVSSGRSETSSHLQWCMPGRYTDPIRPISSIRYYTFSFASSLPFPLALRHSFLLSRPKIFISIYFDHRNKPSASFPASGSKRATATPSRDVLPPKSSAKGNRYRINRVLLVQYLEQKKWLQKDVSNGYKVSETILMENDNSYLKICCFFAVNWLWKKKFWRFKFFFYNALLILCKVSE